MKKAFDEGWGGVICKTLSLDSSKVRNVTPRYARLKAPDGSVMGWENIELISDRSFDTMLDDLKRLKEEYPNRRAAPARALHHQWVDARCVSAT
jgi:dihydropyrimidine dehydrogenase (NADP+)